MHYCCFTQLDTAIPHLNTAYKFNTSTTFTIRRLARDSSYLTQRNSYHSTVIVLCNITKNECKCSIALHGPDHFLTSSTEGS